MVKPYRLARMHLVQLSKLDDRRTDVHYCLLYADIEHQPDFIVLRKTFDDATRVAYEKSQHIQAIIDDKWRAFIDFLIIIC